MSCFIITSILITSGCSKTSDDPAQNNTSNKNSISGFNDFSWGEAKENIQKEIITPDLKEGSDYLIETIDENKDAISILNSEVEYHNAKSGYIFEDDLLTAGAYDFEDMTDDMYNDLLEKYIGVYGEPNVQSEDSGWGPCSVWVDSDKNLLCLAPFFGVIYCSADSFYISYAADYLEYLDIDLKSVLNQ